MRFRDAVRSTQALRNHLQEGLGALRNVDRDRLSCSNPRRLRGSVDVDEALKPLLPAAPRWDYAIRISQGTQSDHVVWLEVHPANSRHVDEVLDKLQWLRAWLEKEARAFDRMPAHFYWVATGAVGFRRGGQEQRRIAQEGLKFPGKRLNLDEF
ncbi:MAG: hypothetical protein ACLP59_05480 [Bryobacteraceae bacterium]